MAGILPFLVKFFYSFCDTSGICSYYTKTSIIDCIESLLLNKHVNLDYHVTSLDLLLASFLFENAGFVLNFLSKLWLPDTWSTILYES